jgi:hypothetical protein
MSLISRINYRKLEDLANTGFKASLTGSFAGAVTDHIIVTPDLTNRDIFTVNGADTPIPPEEKFFIVTGYRISTDSATPIEVKLGFKHGADPTVVFFDGFIGGTAGSVDRILVLGDWVFGAQAYDLVITTGAGNFAFTVTGRVCYEKVPLGFVQHGGSAEHSGKASYGLEDAIFKGTPGI